MIRADQLKKLLALPGMTAELLQAIVGIMDSPSKKTERNKRWQAKASQKDALGTKTGRPKGRSKRPESVPATVLLGRSSRAGAEILPFPSQEESSPPTPSPATAEPFPTAEEIRECWQDGWNGMAKTHHLSAIEFLTDERRKHLKARLIECRSVNRFFDAMTAIEESPWHLGQNDRKWKATFDWFIKPTNFAKMLERSNAQAQRR